MHGYAAIFAFELLGIIAPRLGAASAQSPISGCVQVKDSCLQPKFVYTHFSPDGRYLYFGYEFTAVEPISGSRRRLTSENLARVDLPTNKIEVFRADCRYDYGNPASSRNGRFFVVSVKDRTQRDSNGPLEHLELTDTESNSRRQIKVEENNSRLYFDPFFSVDGTKLYFVRISHGYSVLIFSYDISDGAIELVFPRITGRYVANYPKRPLPPREVVQLFDDHDNGIRYLGRPEFLDRNDEIVFYGYSPADGASRRLVETLWKTELGKIKMEVLFGRLAKTRLVYTINLSTKTLHFHPSSERVDIRKSGLGAFRAIPGKGIFLLNGYYTHLGVDRTIYRYNESARSLEPFDAVDQDHRYQWFDVSPDLRWVAYTHAARLSVSVGDIRRDFLERSEMVIKDRSTGAKFFFDLNSRTADLLDPHACVDTGISPDRRLGTND